VAGIVLLKVWLINKLPVRVFFHGMKLHIVIKFISHLRTTHTPLKITYLHQYFNTPAMSGGTRSYEMARRLVSMGHEVNMVTSWRENDGRKDWFETNEDGVKVHWLPVPYSNNMNYRDRIYAFLKFAWMSAHQAAGISADVIFATSTPLTIVLPAAYASRKRKVPMVFEVRDLWPELPIAMGALRDPLTRSIARWLERFAYRSSSEIIALSPGMSDGIVRTGYPESKVTVIPNSADLERFYPEQRRGREFRARHGIGDDQLLVLYAGTFGRLNDVSYLVYLAEQMLDDKRFHFLTVGSGQDFRKVHEHAERCGVLGKNFSMLERLPKSEMPDVFSAADISTSLFLPLPEMETNSANKFFDGLAAGCCIAINYGGWQEELLESNGAGLRLDRDPAVAARQLRSLTNNSDLLEKAKLQARKLAEDRFSRDKLAIQVEQVLLRSVRNYSISGNS
jgi:glycosyltransferase involved in cell wall biosynthesis